MKLKNYLNEEHYPCLETLLLILNNNRIDENKITDTLFSGIKKLGSHIGLKVNKVDSVFNYIARAEDEMYDLITYATLYLLTTDKKMKDELYNNMKDIVQKTNPKRIASFFMQLDKLSFGFTSMFRTMFLTLFGIEISAYYKWVDDISYLKKELKQMRKVLTRMSAPENLISSLDDFEDRILSLQTNEEVGGEIGAGATTTNNVAQFHKKLMIPIARRKKKKINLRKLLGS